MSVVIRYCGEQNWSCVGWRAALTPPSHMHRMRPAQVSSERSWKSWGAEATGVSPVLAFIVLNSLMENPPTLSANTERNMNNVLLYSQCSWVELVYKTWLLMLQDFIIATSNYLCTLSITGDGRLRDRVSCFRWYVYDRMFKISID